MGCPQIQTTNQGQQAQIPLMLEVRPETHSHTYAGRMPCHTERQNKTAQQHIHTAPPAALKGEWREMANHSHGPRQTAG